MRTDRREHPQSGLTDGAGPGGARVVPALLREHDPVDRARPLEEGVELAAAVLAHAEVGSGALPYQRLVQGRVGGPALLRRQRSPVEEAAADGGRHRSAIPRIVAVVVLRDRVGEAVGGIIRKGVVE